MSGKFIWFGLGTALRSSSPPRKPLAGRKVARKSGYRTYESQKALLALPDLGPFRDTGLRNSISRSRLLTAILGAAPDQTIFLDALNEHRPILATNKVVAFPV
jgi:hypothetical protein